MTQSVELLLEPAAQARTVALWRLLDEAGLRSQAQHRGASNLPHVTLASARAVPRDAEDAVARACLDRLPLDVRLGPLVVLGSGPVALARLVVADAGLLALHDAVAAHLHAAGSAGAVGRWVPHVTLALRMPVDQLPEAVGVLGGLPDERVRLDRARRWDSVARRAWTLS
jgi:2'-5' RNA ligase